MGYQDIRKIRIILNVIPVTFRVIISTIRLVIFIMIIVATFFTVAYSCRMSFLLAISYTAKDSIYISDDNDYLIIAGMLFLFPFSIIGGINIILLIFSFPPVIFLPVWLKIFVLFLILTAIITGLIRFFPQTFRMLSNNIFLSSGKSKLKLSESR